MILKRTVEAPDPGCLRDLRAQEVIGPYANLTQHLAPYCAHSAGCEGTERVKPRSWAWGIGSGHDHLELRLSEADGSWPVTIAGRGAYDDELLLADVYRAFEATLRAHQVVRIKGPNL